MTWWIWIVIGLGLMALEAASPGGLFALFFGLSAILVGVLTGLGLAGSLAVQWILFPVLALVALAALRGPLKGRLNLKGPTRLVDQLADQVAVALEDLPAGGGGKIELRGSSWSARNGGAAVIAKGARCRVERVDGLTLWVRPE
jgi:membrane protein implicated in regulation of membrane protease activity